jgi:hypothetical protein
VYTDAAIQIQHDTMDPDQEQEYIKRIQEQHQSIEDLKGTVLCCLSP